MEYFDIYKQNKEKTNRVHPRGIPMADGDYRYVVQVLVVNSHHQLLIQQRQDDKESYPNMWAFSASGSVIAGETSQQGASRELKEELGIIHDFTETSPFMSFTFEHYFIDYYMTKKDIALSELTLQKEEVKAVQWADEQMVLNLAEKDEFIPYVFLPYLWKFIRKDIVSL